MIRSLYWIILDDSDDVHHSSMNLVNNDQNSHQVLHSLVQMVYIDRMKDLRQLDEVALE